jgi:hypothetical protein
MVPLLVYSNGFMGEHLWKPQRDSGYPDYYQILSASVPKILHETRRLKKTEKRSWHHGNILIAD